MCSKRSGVLKLINASLAYLKKNFKCVEELEPEIIKEVRNLHFESNFCKKVNAFILSKCFPKKIGKKKQRFKRFRTTFSVELNNYFNDSFEDPIVDVVSLILSSENLSPLLRNNITKDNGIQTLFKFLSPNTTLYSVFGFDYDTDQNLNLSVQFNKTLTDSKVVSETIQAIKNTNLKEQKTTYIQNVSLECVFVDTKNNMFSSDGCRSKFSSFSNNITCDCNHATMFTIILSVSLTTVPKSVQVRQFVSFNCFKFYTLFFPILISKLIIFMFLEF